MPDVEIKLTVRVRCPLCSRDGIAITKKGKIRQHNDPEATAAARDIGGPFDRALCAAGGLAPVDAWDLNRTLKGSAAEADTKTETPTCRCKGGRFTLWETRGTVTYLSCVRCGHDVNNEPAEVPADRNSRD